MPVPIKESGSDKGWGVEPLIKWPGGKRAIADQVLSYVPASFDRWFEPFAGGAAVFFALRPRAAWLSDVNADLINLYGQVRDRPVELLGRLRKFAKTEQAYYDIRRSRPRSSLSKAARTYYLCRLAFNGIYRTNKKGHFNVPYGHRPGTELYREAHLVSVSKALQSAVLAVGDFEKCTRKAGRNDVVYFDPPYTVAHAHNGFVRYNEHIFSWSDQERLADHAHRLARRGCTVIVSNADHSTIRALYKGFSVRAVRRQSSIAASARYRGVVSELIFVSKQKG
jgi:DNA adenine methylase